MVLVATPVTQGTCGGVLILGCRPRADSWLPPHLQVAALQETLGRLERADDVLLRLTEDKVGGWVGMQGQTGPVSPHAFHFPMSPPMTDLF